MAPMMMSSNSNTLNVTDAGNGSLHVGEGSVVNGSQSIAIGVGNQVNANNSGAFGDPSIINADESYVLGNDDTINTGATGSFIVGNDSVSNAEGSLIFGSNVTSDGKNSVALGNNTQVLGVNSVALGSGSVASDDNVVSLGNTDLKRRIVNLKDGTVAKDSSDAVTGGQLFSTNERVKAVEDSLADKAAVDASNIDIAKWADKLGTGQVEEGNENLVTGGTVYRAMEDYSSRNSVASFDSQNNQLRIGGSSQFDAVDTVSVAKSDGSSRVITGVATNPLDNSSAANVGYVNAVSDNLINSVNNSFNQMDRKVDKVGANAAALASLTPASFDGDERWSLAASVGSYHGQTAGAVGAFYKPAWCSRQWGKYVWCWCGCIS